MRTKMITRSSMYELLLTLERMGIDPKICDLDYNSSSQAYALCPDNQENSTYVDTSTALVGISGWIAETPVNTAIQDITLGDIQIDATGDVLLYGLGVWTSTLAGAATTGYVKPGTLSIAASNGSPILVDDYVGGVINPNTGYKHGTVNYADGTVSLTYADTGTPLLNSSVAITYKYSPVPGLSPFPHNADVGRVVFMLSASTETVSFTMFGNDPASISVPHLIVEERASGLVVSGTYNSAVYQTENQSPTINMSTDTDYIGNRWMEVVKSAGGGSTSNLLAVFVHWKRVI